MDMTPVNQTVTPETSQKNKQKSKAHISDDKQTKNQSTMAKPDDLQKILAELKLWGNTIKCSFKRQHKYQTLRVKIALSSFALPQFNKFWTTDLGGIPVRWFPTSWTLQERKQCEKFQAVIHDIPGEMIMATLWKDCKPTEFLMKCGASAFKLIQTSKERRKLVGYFENWETTLRALDTPQVFLPEGKVSDSNQPKKKDKQQSSTKASKNNNQLKKPEVQKKAKNTLKNKGGNKDNKEVLAEILSLLRKISAILRISYHPSSSADCYPDRNRVSIPFQLLTN
ncbi:hypothetical protein C1646_769659 [Rhizophagus diaphanus]|nr:hypothetical protein C1646_769659 [Rhizophagus diaphanus] [Rhizophagus sp. MUCL 43196]